MGIFNIFNKKSDNESAATVSLPVVEPSEAKEVVESVAPVKEEASRENKPLTVSYATGWPIDVIYGYLHKNYEDKGFADAMVKSDLAFRDLNMSLIRNKILMVFREINLNYDVMKQDLQVRIDNCNAAGLLTTVAEIEKTMSLINAHKEELSMGEKALFIEHPTDKTNRVKPQDLDKSQLPQGDPTKLPYTICGPYLKKLFDRAFIDGLHNPSARPSAAEWEDALVKTCDLVQPCQNPKCEAHWYVFDNTTKPRCPFCGTEYKGQLPILNFYYAPSHGKYMSENYRLMVYDKQTLYKWHSNRLVSANEKTADEDKKPVGDFHFFNNQWILINRRLPDMYDATDKKPIGIGEYVPLTDGRQILLDKSQGGRLIVVQLVNN